MVYLSARYALIEDSDPEAMGLVSIALQSHYDLLTERRELHHYQAAGTFSKMKASVVCTFRHEAASRLIYQPAGLSDHGQEG